MKSQTRYLIGCLAGLLLFSSCQRELLTPVPQTSITDATAFDTPARVLNQVNSLYSSLKSGNFYGGRAQIAEIGRAHV